MAEEKRTRLKPNPKDYTSVICQIVSEFNEDGEIKRYLGTGSVQIADNCNKLFIVTCAHNFVQETEDFDANELNYAVRSTIFLGRDGKGMFTFKAPIRNYVVHPEYLKRPRIHDGYDIAVASFDLTDALPPIENIDRFKRKVVKVIPFFTGNFFHQSGEQILVIGYPGEKHGHLYEMQGTIHATKKRKGGTEVMIYRDIDTTCGQSGAPVYKKDAEGEWEIIGIHVGFFKKKKANLATIITLKLRNWIIGCIEGNIPIDLDFDPTKRKVNQPIMRKNNSKDEIEMLLKDLNSEDTVLDAKFILKLDGKSDRDKSFIQKVCDMEFPPFTKLEIKNLDAFTSNERNTLVDMMTNATPESLKSLVLVSSNHTELKLFIEGLSRLLEVVTDELYLENLSLDNDTLATIFKKAHKVKRLVLNWCYVEVLPSLDLDWEIDYNIEHLDLHQTCNEFDSK